MEARQGAAAAGRYTPAADRGWHPRRSSDLSAPTQVDPRTGLPVENSDLSAEPLAPPAGSDSASLDAPGAGAGTISRTDLLGGWTITTQGDSCQLFMTLTSWTGGYRASTRGCNGNLLKSISAWNLQGERSRPRRGRAARRWRN